MEKKTPHCPLPKVKALIDAGKIRLTANAVIGGEVLGMDRAAIVTVVKSLTMQDFYKSMRQPTPTTVSGKTSVANEPSRDTGGRRVPQADGVRRRAGCFIQRAINMKCPVCGAAELVRDTRDMPYTYKGESTIIPALVNGN